jgi:hypothetical protein
MQHTQLDPVASLSSRTESSETLCEIKHRTTNNAQNCDNFINAIKHLRAGFRPPFVERIVYFWENCPAPNSELSVTATSASAAD